MKALTIVSCCLLAIAISCHNPDISARIPKCIYKEITNNSKSSSWTVGSVKEYEFQGKLVYSFDPDITRIRDGANIIKDANCNTICTVGGFAGPQNSQCKGEDFFQKAVYKRTIWERKKELNPTD